MTIAPTSPANAPANATSTGALSRTSRARSELVPSIHPTLGQTAVVSPLQADGRPRLNIQAAQASTVDVYATLRNEVDALARTGDWRTAFASALKISIAARRAEQFGRLKNFHHGFAISSEQAFEIRHKATQALSLRFPAEVSPLSCSIFDIAAEHQASGWLERQVRPAFEQTYRPPADFERALCEVEKMQVFKSLSQMPSVEVDGLTFDPAAPSAKARSLVLLASALRIGGEHDVAAVWERIGTLSNSLPRHEQRLVVDALAQTLNTYAAWCASVDFSGDKKYAFDIIEATLQVWQRLNPGSTRQVVRPAKVVAGQPFTEQATRRSPPDIGRIAGTLLHLIEGSGKRSRAADRQRIRNLMGKNAWV